MADRGRKPKATHLHVVDGTERARHESRQGEPIPSGRPVKPPKLTKRQRELWEQYIDTAFWLTEHDSPKAHVFICLYAEFERSPGKMVSAKISQMRAAGSELGLDPASRARLGGGGAGKNPGKTKNEFFDE